VQIKEAASEQARGNRKQSKLASDLQASENQVNSLDANTTVSWLLPICSRPTWERSLTLRWILAVTTSLFSALEGEISFIELPAVDYRRLAPEDSATHRLISEQYSNEAAHCSEYAKDYGQSLCGNVKDSILKISVKLVSRLFTANPTPDLCSPSLTALSLFGTLWLSPLLSCTPPPTSASRVSSEEKNKRDSDSSLLVICANFSLNSLFVGPKVQNGRKEQKTALAEYYKNHGISDHH